MLSQRKDLHKALIQCMQSEAYPVSDKGVCAGWVMMGVRAYFNKTLSCFKRLSNDFLHPPVALTYEHRAFLDGIELYQQPEKHAQWFLKPVSALTPEIVTALTAAEYIEAHGGLITFDRCINTYSRLELSQYFLNLEKAVQQTQKPFAVTIATTTHRIALCYEVESQQWLVLDINQWPLWQFKTLDSPFFFRWLMLAFDGKFPLDLVNKFYCLQEDVACFKTLNLPCLQTALPLVNTELLGLAARHGDISTLSRLKKQGINFNQEINAAWTPVMLAAEAGQLPALQWLVEQGANVNATLPDGGCALFVAAQQGHADVVGWLLGEVVNVEQGMTLSGAEWLRFAKQYAAEQAILDLMQQKGGASFSQRAITLSPYEIALALDRREVVKVMNQAKMGLFAPPEAPAKKKERPRLV